MSPVSLVMKESSSWDMLNSLFDSGGMPQSCAVVAELGMHESIAHALAKRVLCLHGAGDDACAACASWTETGEHPDLIVSGVPGESPRIDRCREMIEEISLRPVASSRRFAVFFGCDGMSPGAANCLLKTLEEPPAYAHILLLLETNTLLPTLRSRCWFRVIPELAVSQPRRLPGSDPEWIEWIGIASKGSPESVCADLRDWCSWACETGNMPLAESIDRLRMVFREKRLSLAMSIDAVILVLREEVPCEQIFGALR